jgi:hypothetical protein
MGLLHCSIGMLREQNEFFDFFASLDFGKICLSLQMELNTWKPVDNKTILAFI